MVEQEGDKEKREEKKREDCNATNKSRLAADEAQRHKVSVRVLFAALTSFQHISSLGLKIQRYVA